MMNDYLSAILVVSFPACAGQARGKAVEQNRFQRRSAVSWVKLIYTMLTAGKLASLLAQDLCHLNQVCDAALLRVSASPLHLCADLVRSPDLNSHKVLCDRHQEAIVLLKAVIKEAPNLPAAWHTMGWVHEARGNIQKALDFFMVSAHLSKVSLHRVSAPMPTVITASLRSHHGIR